MESLSVRVALFSLVGLAFGLFLTLVIRSIRLERPTHAAKILPFGTAALFAIAAVGFDTAGVAVLVSSLLGVLLACGLVDLSARIIPNRIVYPSLALFAVAIAILSSAGEEVSLGRALLGLLSYGGALLAAALISPAGMGMGDVKLAALIGLVLGSLGWRHLALAAFAGVLLGGVAGLVALARGSRAKQTLPYGPYLASGALVSAVLAPGIVG